jgi:micrococcal nuclease
MLLVAGLGIVWWTNGEFGGTTSGHLNVVEGPPSSAPGLPKPPLGVPANAQQLKVAYANDGYTINADPTAAASPINTTMRIVVRLIGVDAPPRRAANGRAECFATDAYRALQRLAPAGSLVWVVADAQLRDADKRYLLYVWNNTGTFVNLALAEGGFVRRLAVKRNTARQSAIDEAIAAAMTARRGLWGRCAPK